MTNKYLSIISLLFGLMLTLNFRCYKENAEPFKQTFEVPVDIYPAGYFQLFV